MHRYTYGDFHHRVLRLMGALKAAGVKPGDRVATFAWNRYQHLELYFAVPCLGAVLHMLNIRLSTDQLTYLINHAEDRMIFVDESLAEQLAPVQEHCKGVERFVVMREGGSQRFGLRGETEYEDFLASAEPVTELPELDENTACALCYTSGTTGNPKGVVYSHRSTFLHTMGAMTADSLGASERDVILPVVPMFHANAWGLAHAAVATGAGLVMPGPNMVPKAIAEMIEVEKVTVAAGVPTIWMGVLPELEGRDTSSLRAIPCGGSAVPKALSEAYRAQTGLPILQAWGMTETSPIASTGRIKSYLEDELDDDALADLRATQGLPSIGVDARVVDQVTGERVPWDGETRGELQVAGPWIAREYYDDDRSPESFTDDGWLKTGDVATVTAEGYLRLVDRTKDVIKSGGEWISSVELENEIMAHPAVAEAAVIGVSHPKWQERPLACVVVAEGQALTAEELQGFLEERVAKWWLPDDIVFIDEVPKTSEGKFSKKDLRERFADHVLPTADA